MGSPDFRKWALLTPKPTRSGRLDPSRLAPFSRLETPVEASQTQRSAPRSRERMAIKQPTAAQRMTRKARDSKSPKEAKENVPGGRANEGSREAAKAGEEAAAAHSGRGTPAASAKSKRSGGLRNVVTLYAALQALGIQERQIASLRHQVATRDKALRVLTYALRRASKQHAAAMSASASHPSLLALAAEGCSIVPPEEWTRRRAEVRAIHHRPAAVPLAPTAQPSPQP